MEDANRDVYRFAEFVLMCDELRRGDDRVEIDPAPLRLLRHLVANRGRTIRHDELRRVLWAGQAVVTPDAIAKTVDPGRPMIMRIPFAVGEAHWSWKNPLKWERFDIVKPKR